MISSSELQSVFAQNTGTENYYLFPPLKQKYTDDVKNVVDKAEAGWLLSDILVLLTALKRRDFTSIKLTVKDKKAILLLTDGNFGKVYEQVYKYTDFPEGEWIFFFQDNVLMLNTKY